MVAHAFRPHHKTPQTKGPPNLLHTHTHTHSNAGRLIKDCHSSDNACPPPPEPGQTSISLSYPPSNSNYVPGPPFSRGHSIPAAAASVLPFADGGVMLSGKKLKRSVVSTS